MTYCPGCGTDLTEYRQWSPSADAAPDDGGTADDGPATDRSTGDEGDTDPAGEPSPAEGEPAASGGEASASEPASAGPETGVDDRGAARQGVRDDAPAGEPVDGGDGDTAPPRGGSDAPPGDATGTAPPRDTTSNAPPRDADQPDAPAERGHEAGGGGPREGSTEGGSAGGRAAGADQPQGGTRRNPNRPAADRGRDPEPQGGRDPEPQGGRDRRGQPRDRQSGRERQPGAGQPGGRGGRPEQGANAGSNARRDQPAPQGGRQGGRGGQQAPNAAGGQPTGGGRRDGPPAGRQAAEPAGGVAGGQGGANQWQGETAGGAAPQQGAPVDTGPSLADQVKALPFGRSAAVGAGLYVLTYAVTYLAFLADVLVINGSKHDLSMSNLMPLSPVENASASMWQFAGWLLYEGQMVTIERTRVVETPEGQQSTTEAISLFDPAYWTRFGFGEQIVTPLLYTAVPVVVLVVGGALFVRFQSGRGDPDAPGGALLGASLVVGYTALAAVGAVLVSATGGDFESAATVELTTSPVLPEAVALSAGFAVVAAAVGGAVASSLGGDGGQQAAEARP